MTVEQQVPEIPGYRDVALLSGGSSSLVFRAVQTRLSRTVAIKVLLIDGDTTREQYERELETTVLLSSQPHIVGIIDTGVTPAGNPYIVMEYCPGGSYAQILRQRGPLPVVEVVDLGAKIADALQAAHDVGVIHRDVKPSNILRSAFGPALTDFGIARAPHQLTGTLSLDRMTPYHASPEAMRRDSQSPASDIYSLASTLWHLLAGHPPFADQGRPLDLDELRQRVLHQPAPPVGRPDVPAWLQRELARALAKDPASRHPDAHTFAEVLRYQAWRDRESGRLPAPGVAGPADPPAPPHSPPAPGSPVPGSPAPGGPGYGSPVPAPREAFRWPAAAPTRRSDFDLPAGDAADPVPLDEAAAASTILWPAGGHGAPAGDTPPGTSLAPAAEGPAAPGTASGDVPGGTAAPGEAGPQAAVDERREAARRPDGADHGGGPARLSPPAPPPHSLEPHSPAPIGRVPVRPREVPPWSAPSSPAPRWADPSSAPPSPQTGRPPSHPAPSHPATAPPATAPYDRTLADRRPGRRSRGVVLVAAASVLAAAVAVGLVLGLRGGGAPQANPPVSTTPSPGVTGTLTETDEGAPADVRLTDKKTSVTIAWTDPTDGTVRFAVLGGPRGTQPVLKRLLDPGVTTLTLHGLNSSTDYCYIVLAIYGTQRYARAPQVCTHR